MFISRRIFQVLPKTGLTNLDTKTASSSTKNSSIKFNNNPNPVQVVLKSSSNCRVCNLVWSQLKRLQKASAAAVAAKSNFSLERIELNPPPNADSLYFEVPVVEVNKKQVFTAEIGVFDIREVRREIKEALSEVN